MAKPYSVEVKTHAVSYAMDRLDQYNSVYSACADMAPRLNVSRETLRRWVVQAQIAAGGHNGPTSDQLAEIKALKSKVRDLEEVNEILKQSTIFFARELDPRRH